MLWLLSWFYQRCQRCCSLSPSVSCGRQTQEGKRWSAAAWSQNPGRFDAGGASLVPARRKVRPPPRGRCWPTPRSDLAHPSASPEVRTQEQKCLCECLDLLQHFFLLLNHHRFTETTSQDASTWGWPPGLRVPGVSCTGSSEVVVIIMTHVFTDRGEIYSGRTQIPRRWFSKYIKVPCFWGVRRCQEEVCFWKNSTENMMGG